MAFPFLMAILLWYAPNRIKEFMGLVKGEILKEKKYVCRWVCKTAKRKP